MAETKKQGIFRRTFIHLATQGCHASADLMKIKAAKLHLQSVQTIRHAVIGLLALIACLLLFFAGFAMAHLAIILLAGWSLFEAGLFLAVCAGTYMILAVLLLAHGLSATKWMRITRCHETLSEVADAIQPRH